MNFELIHTSVQKGLRGGAGFATAVATDGIPAGLEPILEEMSAFDVDAARSTGADEVDWCHRIVTVQGRSYTVLSRVAACGPDWSGRPNRVAHHLVLEATERPVAGPAWTLANFRSFATSVPAVEARRIGPVIPPGTVTPRVPSAWRQAGLDPGWAGVVAGTLLDGGGAVTYLVLPRGGGTLALLEDVFALLPPDRRWTVTFSTRFSRLPTAARCQLRLVCEGAPGVGKFLAEPGCRKIVPKPGVSAGDSPAAEAARAGAEIHATVRAAPIKVHPQMRDIPVNEVDPVDAGRHAAPAARPASAFAAATRTDRPASGDIDFGAIAQAAHRPAPASPPGRGWAGMLPLPLVDLALIIYAVLCLLATLIVLAKS